MESIEERKQWLATPLVSRSLSTMARGIERETLRVSLKGTIAQTPHPQTLGAALCHPSITTDYSEALLELITKPYHCITQCINALEDLHIFVVKNLEQERLWPLSMPPIIHSEQDIPIARYGESAAGQMKHIYRKGLGIRYGRAMQSIAGIHYNMSYPDQFWQILQQQYYPNTSLQACKDQAYFGLVRSFLQEGWILTLLTGASPFCHNSFIGQHLAQQHHLEPIADYYQAYYGCSLRMSGIGYQNSAQAELNINYKSLQKYINSLSQALKIPSKAYEQQGLYDANHEQQQLSTHILQIENEFYGSIRPKQVAQSLERPTLALERRGVAYVEIRNIDIDPNAPCGISKVTAAIIEIFVTYCLLAGTTTTDQDSSAFTGDTLATNGRQPDLNYVPLALERWQGLKSIAIALDAGHQTHEYTQAYQAGLSMLQNPETLPSAQALQAINQHKNSPTPYRDYANQLSQQHYKTLSTAPQNDHGMKTIQEQTTASLLEFDNLPPASHQQLRETLAVYFHDLPDTLACEATQPESS